jgi:uncharacterized protein (DUF1697 family)
MSRYFAFLRTINVGGHTVKMDVLRQIFESFGFTGVETFIASGNVIFEAGQQDPAVLEKALGRKATLRGVGTVKKMAEKFVQPEG